MESRAAFGASLILLTPDGRSDAYEGVSSPAVRFLHPVSNSDGAKLCSLSEYSLMLMAEIGALLVSTMKSDDEFIVVHLSSVQSHEFSKHFLEQGSICVGLRR